MKAPFLKTILSSLNLKVQNVKSSNELMKASFKIDASFWLADLRPCSDWPFDEHQFENFSKVRKGMLNAAEIAKQADAMLAEREQEMKELEQQKRRARDIMFKKTQQLKVRPPNPVPYANRVVSF